MSSTLHTSIFCAVWHKDPQRLDLLRQHAENIARQTVKVKPIYVFDGGEIPPDWLPGYKISVSEPLTIYQAWNVALSVVDTPFVMNLNLDDRIAPDAVAHLETALVQNEAALVGGDWKICYSQEDTNAVTPCYSAFALPFIPTWPLPKGTVTRLGSGTGERGTFGPATLWRMDAHIGAPRYPWRLPDGTLIRSAGDSAWWGLLQSHLKRKVIRLPEIIGNYYSHPDTQAEFRIDYDEFGLITQQGLSLL